MNDSPKPPADKSAPPQQEKLPVIDGKQLFAESKELIIDYAGVRYRLRVTRRGRLILTK